MWILDKNASGTLQNDPTPLAKARGDSFVKTLNFGRESVFQIDFDKDDFIGISEPKGVIERELRSFLAKFSTF